jgi:hypothetical protein
VRRADDSLGLLGNQASKVKPVKEMYEDKGFAFLQNDGPVEVPEEQVEELGIGPGKAMMGVGR